MTENKKQFVFKQGRTYLTAGGTQALVTWVSNQDTLIVAHYPEGGVEPHKCLLHDRDGIPYTDVNDAKDYLLPCLAAKQLTEGTREWLFWQDWAAEVINTQWANEHQQMPIPVSVAVNAHFEEDGWLLVGSRAWVAEIAKMEPDRLIFHPLILFPVTALSVALYKEGWHEDTRWSLAPRNIRAWKKNFEVPVGAVVDFGGDARMIIGSHYRGYDGPFTISFAMGIDCPAAELTGRKWRWPHEDRSEGRPCGVVEIESTT